MRSSSQSTQATSHPRPSIRATGSPIENHTCTHVVRMFRSFQEGRSFPAREYGLKSHRLGDCPSLRSPTSGSSARGSSSKPSGRPQRARANSAPMSWTNRSGGCAPETNRPLMQQAGRR